MKPGWHRSPTVLCRGLLAVTLGMSTLPAFCATPQSRPEIGRLFFQPAERRSLDERRHDHLRGDGVRREGQAAGSQVSLDGFLRREGAPAVVWLNGVARNEHGPETELAHSRGVPDAESRLVITSHGGARARLKPGQVWDPARGTLHDCRQCSRVEVAAPDAGASATMVAEHGATP